MNLSSIIGLVFVLVFGLLMIIFSLSGRKKGGRYLRSIPAFVRLRRAIGLAVEDGSRLHLSIGSGGVIGKQSAPAFVGLAMLERIGQIISVSDRPPIATSGESSLSILSRDTLRSTYEALGEDAQYDPSAGRLTGLTPFSYAAGAMAVIHEEQVSGNVLVGSFGSEVALLADAGERVGGVTLAGADNLSGQAVIYATAQQPLIGEEVFAGGAYLRAGAMHTASLRVQDIFRWLIVVLILVGLALKFFGFDQIITELLAGGL